MKKSRFTDEQIIGFLKQAEGGMPVKELCRLGGFSDATFYKWRAKFGGMQASEATRLREIEGENAKLKKLLAEAHLHIEALKVVFGGKRCPRRPGARRLPGWFRNCPSVSAAPVAMRGCPEPATGSRPA